MLRSPWKCVIPSCQDSYPRGIVGIRTNTDISVSVIMFIPRRVAQFLLPYLILLLPVSSAWRDGHPPTPWCDFCIPASVQAAPGIGFDLTTSYG
jgi:hypothetical protein